MGSVSQILDSVKATVDEVRQDLEAYEQPGCEVPESIETPALDAMVEEIAEIIEGRKTARRSEREMALYERRMKGDWS